MTGDAGLTTRIRQAETIPVSVRWHLENPPAEADEDFSADERALAAATGS